FLSLLLSCVCSPRDPRSFPTRRSSDLFAAHVAAVLIKRVVRRRRPEHEAIRVHVATPSRLSFPSAHATSTTAAALLLARTTGSVDRKSTRLNSSHVKISYAVFCLKKKK